MMKQTMRPSMKTTMFATDMVDPVIGFDIPGKPRTTASTITSTMTPATSRMKEGMTGANAPQDLFEVNLSFFYTWKDIAMRMGYCYVETLDGTVGLQPEMLQVRPPPDLIWNPMTKRELDSFGRLGR